MSGRRGWFSLAWMALLILGLSACTWAAPTVVIGPEPPVGPVTLQVGQALEVHLAANPTTGYAWALEDDPEPVLVPQGDPEYRPDPGGAIGAGGVEVWRFQAGRPGEVTLRWVYRQPWEPDAAPARVFHLQVQVHEHGRLP